MSNTFAATRAVMYRRTIGMTREKSDELRTWIDATLAEAEKLSTWRPVSSLPPVKEDNSFYTTSDECLVTDGKEVFIAYHRVWHDSDMGRAEWMRGEWAVYNLTHWQPLPQLPGGAK